VNLLIVPLPVRLPAGKKVSVPEWLISSRIIAGQGTITVSPGAPSADSGLSIASGYVTIEFQLPAAPQGVTATRLHLVAALRGSSPAASAVAEVSAYNFTNQTWERLAGQFPAFTFTAPSACMSRDGRVLIRIEALSGAVDIERLALAAEVETF